MLQLPTIVRGCRWRNTKALQVYGIGYAAIGLIHLHLGRVSLVLSQPVHRGPPGLEDALPIVEILQLLFNPVVTEVHVVEVFVLASVDTFGRPVDEAQVVDD